MLSAYLSQTAEYRPCVGTDDRGQPVHADAPVFIRCRKEQHAQNVLTATGQTIQTQHVYYLKDKVCEGDLLDGRIVMGVSAWTFLDGRVLGYKAVV